MVPGKIDLRRPQTKTIDKQRIVKTDSAMERLRLSENAQKGKRKCQMQFYQRKKNENVNVIVGIAVAKKLKRKT